MSSERKELGKWGESVAREFLTDLGYKIETANFRTRRGEIDLVCWDKENVVFVEIKTFKSNLFKTPQEGYSNRQQNNLRRMAEIYLIKQSYKKEPVGIRFDFVGIKNVAGKTEITHLKNITIGDSRHSE